MKHTFLLVLLVLAFSFSFSLLSFSPVSASGNIATSSSTTVKIITNPDGTTYLSTEVDPSTASRSTTSHRNGKYTSLLGTVGLEIPEGFARNLAQVINAVLSFVMVIASLLVLLYLIWGAFDWITSGGDKGKIQGARQKIVAAVIGLVIVASSYAILILAVRFLGFESLDDVFDSVRTLDTGRPLMVEEATPSASATTSAKTK